MLVAKKERSGLHPVDGIPLRELPIDDLWRAAARARMKEVGVNQHELAEHVGCKQGNVSQLLSYERQQARALHAQRISVALGIDLTLPAQAEIIVAAMIKADENVAKTMIDSWRAVADRFDAED